MRYYYCYFWGLSVRHERGCLLYVSFCLSQNPLIDEKYSQMSNSSRVVVCLGRGSMAEEGLDTLPTKFLSSIIGMRKDICIVEA